VPNTLVKSRWNAGNLDFQDSSGNVIATFDSANRKLAVPAGATLELAGGGVGLVVMQSVLFTQTTGNGTYTGTIALPAGARIIDIGVDGQVLWDASTSASMTVGDDGSANGFFTATDLNATDLLAGEINNLEHPGGKAGSYIASEQRVLYSATARNVIGVVAQVGTGAAGRTRLYVVYSVVAVPGAAVKV
jgi:hypothetical protein